MLLDEIVSLATDGESSLKDLLRKCLVLAYKLKNDELKDWVQRELNGYDETDPLPDYRRTGSQLMGRFEGWGGSTFSRAIPSRLLEEKHRERLAGPVDLRQGISAYQELLSVSPPVPHVTLAWDANYIVYYQTKFIDGYVLVSAAREIPRPSMVELIDTVRNRVLKMALDLQAELGDSDINLSNIPAEKTQKVESAIQAIYAGQVFVTTGHSTMHVQQHNLLGSWQELQEALQRSGLTEADTAELSSAVDQDGKRLGPKIQQWAKDMAPKVLAGGVKMGAEVGKQVLLRYVKQYLGLP